MGGYSNSFPAFPFRKPARKAAAVALRPVPCRVYRAVISHQQHNIKALGAAQRIDRLARGLRDWPGNIEGGVDGYLDAEVAAERLEIGVGEGIVLRTHDLNPPGAVGMDYCWNLRARLRLRMRG